MIASEQWIRNATVSAAPGWIVDEVRELQQERLRMLLIPGERHSLHPKCCRRQVYRQLHTMQSTIITAAVFESNLQSVVTNPVCMLCCKKKLHLVKLLNRRSPHFLGSTSWFETLGGSPRMKKLRKFRTNRSKLMLNQCPQQTYMRVAPACVETPNHKCTEHMVSVRGQQKLNFRLKYFKRRFTEYRRFRSNFLVQVITDAQWQNEHKIHNSKMYY